MENWRLTDAELAKLAEIGGNAQVAQAQKKALFMANGGIILNPNALSDLYEALKYAKAILILARGNPKGLTEAVLASAIADSGKALSKAEGHNE